ncbi:MAG: potassium channel family protein [Desulfobacterales bacterium]
MTKDIFLFSQVIFRDRFLYLLIFILMLIAIQPLDEAIGKLGIVLDIIVSAILLSAIYVISGKRIHIVIGVFLAAPLLISLWTAYFFTNAWLPIIGLLCGIAFFAFIIVIILKFIFSQDEITKDLIAGAAVVYLLMAIMWAFAYRVIEMIHSGSFSIAQGHSLEHQFSFQYYSFVTLTTLGYGDIFPLSTAARACAILEAVIGQLYLVITIAWLVGVQISQSMQRKK